MTHNIAVIAGDGIGKEVIPAGIAALERATKGSGASLRFTDLPWGCDYYLQQGRMMDADGFEFVNSVPKPSVGASLAERENLFAPHDRGTAAGRVASQVAAFANGYREGGFFIMIGRKPEGRAS